MKNQLVRTQLGIIVTAFALLIGSFAQAQVNAQSIQAEINSSAKLSKTARAQLTQLYTTRNFEPIWVNAQGLTQAALNLRSAIPLVSSHGLPVNDYWPATVDAAFVTALDPVAALNQEIALSRILVALAKDVTVGRVDPSSVGDDVKFEQRSFDQWALLQQAVANQSFNLLWDQLAPQHEHYKKLKQVLSKLKAIQANGGFAPIGSSPTTLKLGSVSSKIVELKQRAKLMGYFISNLDNRFDSDLEAAIKDIQKANLATASGRLSPTDKASWEFFSVSSARRIQQTELNMEKFRWLPRTLESRHVFVNLAIQQAQLVDPNLTNYNLEIQGIINGRAARKTPSMRDEIYYLVMNPTWTVPITIFSEDKLPLIQGLALQGPEAVRSWFFENRFKVLTKDLKTELDPASIDWINLNPKASAIYIQQQPGYDNALGVVKFMMRNPYSIYFHDTNDRNLFATKSNRLISSGCLRLPFPIDFAEYLLKGTKWDRYAIEDHVAKPGEIKDDDTTVLLPQANRLPVYIISITARLGDDGVMRFTQDHYQQNLALLNKLKASGFYR